jgi:hypothetical protein
MFVGLYAATYKGLLAEDTPNPHNDGTVKAGSSDCYELQLDQKFKEYKGKLFIKWGGGSRVWIQRANRQDKEVIKLLTHEPERDFPGYLYFSESLSKIELLPKNWIDHLKDAKGVYVLTSVKTKEHYVGSASGEGGFLQRWIQHSKAGYGDSIKLNSQKYSDLRVGILEVAGSSLTNDEIKAMEVRWMNKLQSREIGLN